MTNGFLQRSLRSALLTRMLATGLLGVFLIIWGRPAVALDPSLQLSQYMLDQWQTSEGLPQNGAVTIARTPDGYLWLGTQEGLARFDGARFVVFDRNNEPALPDNVILVLYVDRSGRLWIGTQVGLAVLENGQFKRFDAVAELAHGRILSILEDRAGRLWVGTEHGLVEVDHERGRVFGTSDGLRDASIGALLEDRKGMIWVATATGGLHRFDGTNFESMQLSPGRVADPVSSMYEDHDGMMWFGTETGGLYRKPGDHFEVVAPAGQLGSGVRALTRDPDGNMWIATSARGLLRLRDGIFSAPDGIRLLSGDLRALYEDNEGSLWIGSYVNGLLRLRDGKFVPLGVPEGLQSNVAWSITPRAAGGIWVGTDAGVSMYVGGVFRHVASPLGFETIRVRSLLEDRKGALWVGTDGAGVYSREGSHVTIYNRHNGLSGNSVKAISEDHQGRIWIGTDVGLDVIDKAKVTSMQAVLGVSDPTMIRVMHENLGGGMWVATDTHGLFLIEAHQVRRFGLNDGLPSAQITAIYEDERGVIWLGTTGGLAVWRDGRFTSLAGSVALRKLHLQVIEDQRHRIWLTSNKGLMSVSRAALDALARGESIEPDIKTYDVSDGLRTAEFDGGNTFAGCLTQDGRLWFPSILGILVVDPSHIRTNTLPPPVQIEQATVDAAPLDLRQAVEVNPGHQQWEFQYTALSLLAAKRARFRYRLEGFDDGWVDAGNRRTAYYTGLPPGSYTFRVIASNNDGIWNDTGASFRFTLKPHFYQTWWFILGCVILLLLLVRVLYHWRVRQLRRLAETLTEQVADRTRDLVLANKQMRQAQDTLVTTARQAGMAEIANNVLHNVGNVLNSVNVSAALIGSKLRDSKSAGLTKAANLMNEHAADLGIFITVDERGKALPAYFTKLAGALEQEKQAIGGELASLTRSIDHIKEIVATQQSYSGTTSVSEPVQVKELLEDALRMNAGSFAHHQINIVKEFAEVPSVLLDKHLMLQILINLIDNAKHALNGGLEQPHQIKLKVDIAKTTDTPRLRIRIEDNGEGIAPENLTRLFAHGFTTRKNGHGFGLHSCALAVKEMKGSISAFSDGLGRGAAFVLELPMNRVPEPVPEPELA
jgi:ligand-binding sensor domain-containing protein/signal transduction histidine kinase